MTLHLTPEEIIARNREARRVWRQSHPDRVKAFHKKYNAKPEVIARKSDWARAHRDEINERRREIYRRKRSASQETEQPQEVTTESSLQPPSSTDEAGQPPNARVAEITRQARQDLPE